LTEVRDADSDPVIIGGHEERVTNSRANTIGLADLMRKKKRCNHLSKYFSDELGGRSDTAKKQTRALRRCI